MALNRVLNDETVRELARRLEEAERTRTPMTQLSMLHPEMTIDDSYAVQQAWRDLKLEAGRTVTGRKIGLTSRAMQRSQEVDEPDRGIYFDDMMWTSGATIPFSRFIRPRVEAEVAFELARPLEGPGVRLTDVLNACAWVFPALEIVDARLEMKDPGTGRSRIITDAIGDNAANAGMITGGRPVRPDAVDLRWIAGALYINGVIEETGVSAAVLGHPASGIAWLANSLVPYGEKLEAGVPILAGAFTRSVFVHEGDTIHADYGPLGPVTCRFALSETLRLTGACRHAERGSSGRTVRLGIPVGAGGEGGLGRHQGVLPSSWTCEDSDDRS